MLSLKRRPGQEIHITDTETGERITVAVLGHVGDQVRIGTAASARFKILRGELQERDRPPDAA